MAGISSFDGFVRRLREIEQLGYVETHRAGNTGIGKTLEDLLGIEENNVPGPDAAGVELKSTRKQSTNLTTLFTKEPPRSGRELWNQALVEELGYVDDSGRPALKTTIEVDEPNNRGFSLSYESTSLSVVHESYGVTATYPLELLRETFERKLPQLVMVLADARRSGGREQFWYNEAYHLDGFDGDEFLALMRESVITVDLRMHVKESGAIRNRGTAWRIMDDNQLVRAFDERRSLL